MKNTKAVRDSKHAFFDSHMHAYNLSHPNMGGFLLRLVNIKTVVMVFISIGLLIAALWWEHKGLSKLVINTSFGILIVTLLIVVSQKLTNFFRMMDSSIGPYLLNIEEDLVDLSVHKAGKRYITYGDRYYDRFVLIPLMMHFTNDHRLTRGRRTKKYYPIARKSIQEQTIDLIQGIQYYHEKSVYNLMRIYPFMGITLNSKNYDLAKLMALLDKYFGYFPDSNRYNLMFDRHEAFKGDIESLRHLCFSGIKVYPPMGFNPWPDRFDFGNQDELDMAKYFYDFCMKRQIPLVTHCGGGGYLSVTKARYNEYAAPNTRWLRVLEEYNDLRICFAHFGPKLSVSQTDSWTNLIMDLIIDKRFPNVYTDISCRCFKQADFDKLRILVRRKADDAGVLEDEIWDYILYGTDFPMNIVKGGTYGSYVKAFLEADMPDALKDKLCNTNPRRFIFNE